VVGLDADVLGDWPGALRYARDVMQDRRSTAPRFERRWYAVEAAPGVTGAIADNRLALSPPDIERLVWRLAARLGIAGVQRDLPAPSTPRAGKWESVLADRLRAHAGACVLVAGDSLS